jgi:biopolymer transport protein ExbD
MLIGKKKEKDVEIPSASLSDIVFLLLIFFLVTTSIDTEKGLDLVLPPPGASDVKIPKKNITNLLINEAGEALLDGTKIEISKISKTIREKLLENELLIVSVKTDDNTEYSTYVRVIDQLKKADAKRISLAEPEQD